jgi:hypothetical protein
MGIVDFVRGFFQSKPSIRGTDDLAHFIDENAAFLVQKGIYDYARARSGHYSKVLLTDEGFQNALNRSRWRAYPLGLAMVGEMVDGVVAPQSGDDRRAVLDPLIRLVLSVFDRYAVPPSLSGDEWQQGREELALHLERLSTHPPKRVIDIPVPFADRYFELMPFDKPFLTPDAPTVRGFFQLSLARMQEELTTRMDAADMARKLRDLNAN